MESKTYLEWREAGRQVRLGEKATGRNRYGVATFTIRQTKQRHFMSYIFDVEGDGHTWNGMTEEEFLGYTPGDR
jgi:hypothetical protein